MLLRHWHTPGHACILQRDPARRCAKLDQALAGMIELLKEGLYSVCDCAVPLVDGSQTMP